MDCWRESVAVGVVDDDSRMGKVLGSRTIAAWGSPRRERRFPKATESGSH